MPQPLLAHVFDGDAVEKTIRDKHISGDRALDILGVEFVGEEPVGRFVGQEPVPVRFLVSD